MTMEKAKLEGEEEEEEIFYFADKQ